MPSDGSLKTSCYDEYVYYDDDADDGGDDDDGGGHDDDDVDSDVMTLVMVRSTAVKMMMKARGRRRKPEEYGGVGRRIRNRLVDFQGARAYCRPLWTLGELADITFDRDDAARSCTTLHFHALPVHVRKGLKNERFA